MSFGKFLKASVAGLVVFCGATSAHAGLVIDHFNPCNASFLACPVPISTESGSLIYELTDFSTVPGVVGLTYTMPQISSGSVMTFDLTESPANNTITFLASATLNAFDASGNPLFSLNAANYDPTGLGGSSYLIPSSNSSGGVTLSESVAGFEGGLNFSALNTSGSPIGFTLTLEILTDNYGSIDIANAYTLAPASAVPLPGAMRLFGAGLFALLAIAAANRRKAYARTA
ncbi:MAG: hypothetical protein ABSB19_00075 [Methylomonas sp.]